MVTKLGVRLLAHEKPKPHGNNGRVAFSMDKGTMTSDEKATVNWRTRIGLAIFAASIGWPVFIPILGLLGASKTTIAAFSGLMLIGAELMLIAAATIVGKEGFTVIKSAVFGFLRSYGPSGEVSRIRYRIGLVLFVAPLLFGWLAPYFGHHLPGFNHWQMAYAIAGDAVLLISLFVLGGGFWDKLRALFDYNAYAIIPDNRASEAESN